LNFCQGSEIGLRKNMASCGGARIGTQREWGLQAPP